ncbi:MAG: bifunctional phosphoribosyl-AMP cyclohydrolase/phosphoribosyl-ATP diphosphatase HisIE [Pyrinomonadaceae bacterium]|nr:bifunctional phosphoribosyl-AMP cyclohydrolase/phosphoribosyl-ATP diphosphatase HisIE [Pyrinomonadaceae bacterium]MBP6213759.1 bifunctional phosphoribosyl-AMP cyclohydrolase/phosphoribosyl-ATP diphosphatase HisIE [Pyrinomonadaceae bacterium]
MNLNYEKYADGLIPAIVQDAKTGSVLMLGFMNAEAVAKTHETRRVTFYSRSRRQLWTKGETSGNFLELVSITADCDQDTVLIQATPAGPVCHTGNDTCFGNVDESDPNPLDALRELEKTIDDRRHRMSEDSYVASLFKDGINKIAQKVGEEAVELIIEAKDNDLERFTSEAADLLFHYLVLLRAKDVSISDVVTTLRSRRR